MGETRAARGRVESLDVMRGIVMVVMALDHTRDGWSSAQFDPTDPAVTTWAMFATRWITHLCAPWFMLLAGAGAYLSQGRGRDRARLSRFLLSRGAWLIVLELTIVKLGWEGRWVDPTYVRVMVIWALGWSMIALAGLVYLPLRAIVAIGVVMVVGHDLLDGIDPSSLGSLSWLWQILHVQGAFGAARGEGWGGYVLYPLIPWIGVMALGYGLGAVVDAPALRDDPRRRARTFALAGLALVVVFVALRAVDLYGDRVAWTHQATAARTAMSFLDVSKYPPSLDYLLATGGLGLLLLASIEFARGPVAAALGVFRTFGRVPLFFYVLHLPLIMFGADVAFRLRNGWWASTDGVGDWGYELPIVYLVWATVVVALYPLCRWFAGVKQRRHDWWLGYL